MAVLNSVYDLVDKKREQKVPCIYCEGTGMKKDGSGKCRVCNGLGLMDRKYQTPGALAYYLNQKK